MRRKGAVNGMVECYTCGKTLHWKEAHAGHFVPRHHTGTRWDERNLRVQCVGCNLFGNGKIDVFAAKLQRELGNDILQELQRAKVTITKISTMEMERLIEDYKWKVEALTVDN